MVEGASVGLSTRKPKPAGPGLPNDDPRSRVLPHDKFDNFWEISANLWLRVLPWSFSGFSVGAGLGAGADWGWGCSSSSESSVSTPAYAVLWCGADARCIYENR